VFGGADDGQLKGLKDYIEKDATYRRDNPGLPVAYQVAFLRDNRFAMMGFPTEYTETQCIRYPNGFVKFKNDGVYDSKTEVTWLGPDQNGNYSVECKWESGTKNIGWEQSVDIPGDAHGLRLKAWCATGIVWDPWGEILNIALEGPSNKCYRFKGTTYIGRGWDNNC
jgi:thiol-activated cytolysin